MPPHGRVPAAIPTNGKKTVTTTTGSGKRKNKAIAKSTSSSTLPDTFHSAAFPLVVEFLPLADLQSTRLVSRTFHFRISQLAMRPHASTSGMMFVTAPSLVGRTASDRSVLQWTCSQCRSLNCVILATCRHCGGQNHEEVKSRVFMGQLPREMTTEVADWLVSFALPTVDVFHIEAHTTKDGRSKGCAWIYLNHPGQEEQLLTLNRRIFVDVDAEGRQGLCISARHNVSNMQVMALSRAASKVRPSFLPRQPLVIERSTQVAPSLFTLAAAMEALPRPPMPVAADSAHGKFAYQIPVVPSPSFFKPKAKATLEGVAENSKGVVVTKYTHNPYAFHPVDYYYRSLDLVTA